MNMIDIISKKRDGIALSKEEIEFFVEGYTEGSIPDYQASALLMAIYFQDINDDEIFWLTDAMKRSGDIIDLSGINGIKVDKHSTGGVGDKTTFIVAPIAAACGVPIAKMSGRGLGHTGGTVDKMESIPGFRTSLEPDEFMNQVNSIGMSVIGQTAHVATADKKLYALRDVTGTVANIGLITSSIMSKKLASGSDAIVLDVKCGNGAFMDTEESAVVLGEKMVEIGNMAGKKMVAVISDMNQPLGKAVGNSLEVIEAIETLKGRGPADITELGLELAGIMIYIGGCADSPEEGRRKAEEAVASGTALKKFAEFVSAQGGDSAITENYDIFAKPAYSAEVLSETSGYVSDIYAQQIGIASQHSGAGRERKEDDIDMTAGIYLYKKVGDSIEKGEKIAAVYGNDEKKVREAAAKVLEAYRFSAEKTEAAPIIKKIIGI